MRMIQHDYLDDPWKMMVVCLIIETSKEGRLKPLLGRLFDALPTPQALVGASTEELQVLLGDADYRQRLLKALPRMSQDAIDGKLVGMWFSVNRYALDSWVIFICGRVLWPDDSGLRKYMDWCAETGERPPSYEWLGEIYRPLALNILRTG